MQVGDVDRVVGALGDRTRRDILFSFYRSPGPRTVDEVGREAGVHRTVAFAHLERLLALGYLSRQRRRGPVGKPANLYRLAAGPVTLSHPGRDFRLLSRLLTESVHALGAEGAAAAHEAGRGYGAGLARPAAGVEEALAPLAGLGGGYRRDGEAAIVARNCVFREACGPSGGVACDVHAGILEGLLEGSGVGAAVIPEGPRELFACAFRLMSGVTLPPSG
ncbi:MAG: hypothetical protein ACREPI_05220 [Candidatus Dormibacterales bacterium]